MDNREEIYKDIACTILSNFREKDFTLDQFSLHFFNIKNKYHCLFSAHAALVDCVDAGFIDKRNDMYRLSVCGYRISVQREPIHATVQLERENYQLYVKFTLYDEGKYVASYSIPSQFIHKILRKTYQRYYQGQRNFYIKNERSGKYLTIRSGFYNPHHILKSVKSSFKIDVYSRQKMSSPAISIDLLSFSDPLLYARVHHGRHIEGIEKSIQEVERMKQWWKHLDGSTFKYKDILECELFS